MTVGDINTYRWLASAVRVLTKQVELLELALQDYRGKHVVDTSCAPERFDLNHQGRPLPVLLELDRLIPEDMLSKCLNPCAKEFVLDGAVGLVDQLMPHVPLDRKPCDGSGMPGCIELLPSEADHGSRDAWRVARVDAPVVAPANIDAAGASLEVDVAIVAGEVVHGHLVASASSETAHDLPPDSAHEDPCSDADSISLEAAPTPRREDGEDTEEHRLMDDDVEAAASNDEVAEDGAPPVSSAAEDSDLRGEEAIEEGKCWRHLSPETASALDGLENIGDRVCTLLHGHVVRSTVKQLQAGVAVHVSLAVVCEVVARAIVRAWTRRADLGWLLRRD